MTECHECGRSGIKLWRSSEPQQGQLLCNEHLEPNGLDRPELRCGPGVPSNIMVSYVPAVVITGGENGNKTNPGILFYSITDVPEDAANIWRALPE